MDHNELLIDFAWEDDRIFEVKFGKSASCDSVLPSLSFYLYCSIVIIIIITIIVIVGFHCKREQKIKRRKRKQSKAALDENVIAQLIQLYIYI